MLTKQQPIIFTHPTPIDAISRIRRDWEEAAEGESLIDLKGSVGLLLADIAEALGLSQEEIRIALGTELFEEASHILSAPLFRLNE